MQTLQQLGISAPAKASWSFGMVGGLLSLAILSGCATGSPCFNDKTHVLYEEGKENAFAIAGWIQDGACSDTETYTWENKFTTARISVGGKITAGTMTITVNDASGGSAEWTDSYSGTDQGALAALSSAGTSGTWSVTIVLSSAKGEFGFAATGEPA